MTLILETESHGGVEAGFYATFTQFARLGDYTFATRHLCELAEHLAANPKIYKSQILAYNLDKFWERQKEDMQGLLQIIMKAEQSYFPTLRKLDIDKQIEDHQGQVPIQDEINMCNEGKMIPIKVSDDERSIAIGKYNVAAPHFRGMAFYLTKGGLMGWMNGKSPEFAKSALDAIKNSKRELYHELRK